MTETPTSTKAQCLLIPGSYEKAQDNKGLEKRERRKTADVGIEARDERGTAMKRTSVLERASAVNGTLPPPIGENASTSL